MDRLTHEARRRQAVVLYAQKHGKTAAARVYWVGISSVKRWCQRYDGTWQSLKERSHRPHYHPKQHTAEEEQAIKQAYALKYARWGWEGVFEELQKNYDYKRSFGGMYHAGMRLGLGKKKKPKKPRTADVRLPEITVPGEKVQIDVKFVPYNCLRGAARRDGKRFYQYTAIDECSRMRFIYGYEEHTPENSVDFLERVQRAFPFKIQAAQTDNGIEFTYRFISKTAKSPFEIALARKNIKHILIPPRSPWINGKVERSHRNDQRYFYDWESFSNIQELNQKLVLHLFWSNNKPLRSLGRLSPLKNIINF